MKVIRMIILTVWMHFKSIQGLSYEIPNPCPVTLDLPVVDMCISNIANEKDGNGADYLDSVVLRVMVDRGGCTCDVFIENHIVTTEIFVEKYQNISEAAPENNLCGLAIDIEMLNDESVFNSIECTSGVDRRQFAIAKNDVLRLTSRIIPGNCTRGYCMHIIRDKNTNNVPQRLKMICNESEIYRNGTSSINRTEIIPETTDSSDMMFISIGAGVGSLFITIVGIIVILLIRQGCKIKELMSTANLNMQYDNLSESRNTSSYSTLDRPTTDDHPYDVVL